MAAIRNRNQHEQPGASNGVKQLLCGIALGLAMLQTVAAVAQVGTGTAESVLDLSLRGGLNHTDNLGRVEDGESETFGSIGLDIGFNRSGPRLDARLNGILDYYHYDSDQFSNETIGRAGGFLGVSLLPQRLDWIFENQFGQIRSDPFAPDAPGNREIFNRFETGPDLYMPIDARTALRASARYADRSYERSDQLDSDMRSATVTLQRQLSATQQAGLSLGARRIEFDVAEEFLGSDAYEVQSVYLSYSRELATGELGTDVGVNRLKRAGESDTGLLLRANWTRALTARSRLTLAGGREFQDAGDQFRFDGFDGTGSADIGLRGTTSDPYTATYGSAAYSLDRNRAAFGLAMLIGQDRYQRRSDLDRDITRLDGTVTYRFTQSLSAALRLRLGREDFTRRDDGEIDNLSASLALSRRVGRQWDVSLAYTFAERSSDFGADFEENRLSLLLVWTPTRR